MKKTISLALIVQTLMLFSCKRISKEIDIRPKDPSNLYARQVGQSVEMIAYQAALDEISLPKYFKGQAETANKRELSAEKRQVMLDPSLNLIYSTGISKEVLLAQTNNNEIEIVNFAFTIYKNNLGNTIEY